MANDTSLDEFVVIMKKHVDEFAAYYKKNAEAKKKGESWPLSMPEGEWYEQLLGFLSAGE